MDSQRENLWAVCPHIDLARREPVRRIESARNRRRVPWNSARILIIRVLGEMEQDSTLTRRALDFVREHPGRCLELAVIKLGRYFSPWPNAEEIRSPWPALAERGDRDSGFLSDRRGCLEPAARRACALAAGGPAGLLLCGASRLRQLDPLSNSGRDRGDESGGDWV